MQSVFGLRVVDWAGTDIVYLFPVHILFTE